ncbi:MAG: putative glutamine amidotransferase, partial [Actinomycetota bacterium]|nr:putative glutamine amidotransferase [Actinomycetota bacterium]
MVSGALEPTAPVLIGITGRPIAAGKVGSSAAVGVGVGYLAALERAGAIPVVLAPRSLDAAAARALLERIDGLLFLGGPDVDPALYDGSPHPTITGTDVDDDQFEIALAHAALRQDELQVRRELRRPQPRHVHVEQVHAPRARIRDLDADDAVVVDLAEQHAAG